MRSLGLAEPLTAQVSQPPRCFELGEDVIDVLEEVFVLEVDTDTVVLLVGKGAMNLVVGA